MGWSNFAPGTTFGRWTVLYRDLLHPGKTRYYVCQCSCGTTKSVRGSCLKRGESQSCGCLAWELSSKTKTKEVSENYARIRGTIQYFKSNTWSNLQKRTINGANPNWERCSSYLNKGIRLQFSKDEFYQWCDDNADKILAYYAHGETPSLDRIDNEGHYCLSNIQVLSWRENTAKDAKNPVHLAKVLKKPVRLYKLGTSLHYPSIKETAVFLGVSTKKLRHAISKGTVIEGYLCEII